MGGHETVFASLEERRHRGSPFWWLSFFACRACCQAWLVAQEDRQNDILCMRRLDGAQVMRIVEQSIWPAEFDRYESLLRIGHAAGRSVRFMDPVGSSSLYATITDLARARPGIAVFELCELLNIDQGTAEQIARDVIVKENVEICMSDAQPAPVQINDYDPSWPRKFESERQALSEALRFWLVGSIEHVGSTAVPGLRAKPVIDIMAGVSTLEGSRAAIAGVSKLGYVYSPYRDDVMHWFCKPSPTFRTHHLHLIPFGSPLWQERLAFRNYLRAHPETSAEYATLKDQLAQKHRLDREAYTEAKGPFIRRVLSLASGDTSSYQEDE